METCQPFFVIGLRQPYFRGVALLVVQFVLPASECLASCALPEQFGVCLI